MFRWLALCLVLCAGAFALVALATGKFLPQNSRTDDPAPPPMDTILPEGGVQPVAAGEGADRGGAIVLSNARLAPIEREDAPSQHDGTVLFIGTDRPADPKNPGRELPPMRVALLVIQIGPDDPAVDASHENEWLYLIDRPDSSHSVEAVSRAELTERQKKAQADKKPIPQPLEGVFRRWHDGDQVFPRKDDDKTFKKIVVAFEKKTFHELKEGDWVEKDQLLALVNPTVQVNDLADKVAKLDQAQQDYLEAGKTKGEAERRAKESERLYKLGTGVISLDAYYADVLNAERYGFEEKAKNAARSVAVEEMNASLDILKLHEVRATIPGVIKTIYKHPGEAVKNLDPILHIENPLKMRAEALAGAQDVQGLSKGMTAIVQPTQMVRPLAQLFCSQAEVTCVAVSSRPGASGRRLIVSGSEDGMVRFWKAEVAQPGAKVANPQLATLDEHAAVLALACTGPKAAANLALTGDRDGVGRIIDLDRLLPDAAAGAAAPPMPLTLAEHHRGPITCVAFSPDGTVCATGGEDRAIRLWKVADGKLLLTLAGAHKAAVTSLQFAQPDGGALQLVSAGGDYTLRLWKLDHFDNLDGDSAKPVPTAVPGAVLPYRSGDVAKPGVSADGKHLLFDHGNELRVLSLETQALEGVIQAPGASVNFSTMALFAPDGATILTNSTSDGRLQLWRTPVRLGGDDLGRALELRQFTSGSPGSTATCGAFDTEEKPSYVVTGSRDGYVLVWEMPKPEEVQRKPREARLQLVEHSLEAGARQVRVWADLPEMKDENEWLNSNLTPGGTATLVVPPGAAK